MSSSSLPREVSRESRLRAGIDIGNSTTEIVVVELTDGPPRPLVWDRRPTRGVKGSPESIAAAERLLAQLLRRPEVGGRECAEVISPVQVPVSTEVVPVPKAVLGGPLRVLAASAGTPGGEGWGVGRPVPVSDPPDPTAGPVILVAADPVGFRQTVVEVRRWLACGAEVVGIVAAGDEGRLISSRLASAVTSSPVTSSAVTSGAGTSSAGLPVVDCVPAEAALACRLIALEVAPAGSLVRRMVDPLWLGRVFAEAAALNEASRSEASPGESSHGESSPGESSPSAGPSATDLRTAASALRGLGAAAVGLTADGSDNARAAAGPEVEWADGERLGLSVGVPRLRAGGIGDVAALWRPDATGNLSRTPTADLWAVDVDPSAWPSLQVAAVRSPGVAVAVLADPGAAVAATAEREAAGRGARTTPGAEHAAAVLDLGAGTLDLVTDGAAGTAAGAGELLTVTTAHVLGITRGAAEWVKRGPAVRVDEPRVVTDEAGQRHFRDDPVAGGSVGWLAAPGPAGLLPFAAGLAPAEWRALRLGLKRAVIADNVARLLRSAEVTRGQVLLVGGPAADEELLTLLSDVLPAGVVAGRAEVAGVLGHRYAVAYGLTLH